MKADALPLTKLYDTHNKAYVIPSYQRPFAWDHGKATDLLDAIFEDAASSAKLTSIGTFLFCNVQFASGEHPFGNNAPNSNAPNTVWEVVDGQQRLTVLAIIGFALMKRLQVLTAEGLLYSPILELEQFYRTSRRIAGRSVPLLIRDEDDFDNGYKSDLSRLLNAFSGNELFPPPELGERLSNTVEAITGWVNTSLTSANFEQFCDYLLSKCHYVQVEADDQDTAFMMFEPLNSTSEPLTAFEVFRSKAVRTIQPQPMFPESLRLLDYDNTKRDDVIRRSNQLIFSLAQAVSGKRPRVHFVPLKHYLDSQVTQGFVAHFERGATFLRTVWNEQNSADLWLDEETKNCLRFLIASNHEAPMPLLLRYYQTNANQIPIVVKAVVAFFALWRPAFPTNSLPDIYRNLLKEGSQDNMALQGGQLKSAPELKAYFRGKLELRLGPPPPGRTIEDLWLDDRKQLFLTYEDLKTICRLFVFLDMGASIKSNLVPDDPWTVADDIEHILPTSTQPAPPNIHRVGNLTFLPPSVNKSIKDMNWNDKKEIYALLASTQRPNPPPTKFSDGRNLPPAVQEYLADTKTLALAHLQPLSAKATWSELDINVRTRAILKNVWNILYNQWLQ